MSSAYNQHTPQPLPSNVDENLQLIAPYWADVDTRGTGQIFYRQTNDFTLLTRATNEIQMAFPASQNISVANLVIVTWDSVGYYDRQTDKV